MPERSSYARRRCTEISGVSPTKTIVEKTRWWEKDSPYVLLVFPGEEGLHSISPQVVVKLVTCKMAL